MTRFATALAVALLAVLALAGCSQELGPDPGRGAEAPASLDTARTKLRLQIVDPCYDGDARAAWPRCGRWLEETAGTGRTAARAAPTDQVIAGGSAAVAAGREAFLGRGCGAAGSGPGPDVGLCVDALEQARGGVRTLVGALGLPAS